MLDPVTWLVIKIFIVAFPFYMLYQAFLKSKVLHYSQPEIKGQNIIFVIAHPDDEAMFFVPTIRHLQKQNRLYLLCLSNGNFAGLGKIRERELEKSCEYLGFVEPPTIVEDPDLMDGMQSIWPKDVICNQIDRFMKQHSDLKF